jgi:peptide/nickel transport system substrate-binding protein
VREDILEGRWRPPVHDGTGRDREPARRALELLGEAGYKLVDNRLVKNGDPLSFEIMVANRDQERLALFFASSLQRIGVTASVRLVDEVQYQRRRQKFEFDVMFGTWTASASPGNEQRMRWGSASAAQEGSYNLAGASSPAMDALIAALLSARGREDFVAAVRAYDRVLLSGFYIVPLFHTAQQWDAYWTRLARPASLPKAAAPLFGATLDAWWVKT